MSGVLSVWRLPWSVKCVLMTCFRAVSLTGTTTASSSTAADPGRHHLVAGGCHIFIGGVHLLCGEDSFTLKMLVNIWDLKQMMLWCTDLVSCAWLCAK